MKKRILATLLAAVSLMAVGCSKNGGSSSSSGSTAASTGSSSVSTEENKILEYNSIFVISKERIPDDPSLLDEYLLENFKMKIDWQQIPSSGYEEKLNLIFASSDLPDFAWPVSITAKIAQRYGKDGFLLPLNDYFDKMPNYRVLYTDAEWSALLTTQSNADGKLYFLPQKNYRDTATAWIYRKSAFDEMGLTFPKTTDELYTVLKTIKEKDPAAVPLTDQGKLSVLRGLYVAWGMQENAYINDAGELIPFPRSTNEYREVLKFANKLYSEGLINKEFATTTDQQMAELYANGKSYMQYFYATRVPWAESNMKAADPNVEYEWVDFNVTADASKGFHWERETPYTTAGPVFTEVLTEEKMDRLVEFYDWLCTDEGSLFINMGVEGKTYEVVDGEPRFMSHMYHVDRNPEGTNEWRYGLYLGNIVQHPAYLKEVQKEVDLELSSKLMNNKEGRYFPVIAWTYSEADEKKLADYETVLKDVADEYGMKFIMGALDPNDDSAWETYLKTLDGVGLKEASEIRTKNYSVPQ